MAAKKILVSSVKTPKDLVPAVNDLYKIVAVFESRLAKIEQAGPGNG